MHLFSPIRVCIYLSCLISLECVIYGQTCAQRNLSCVQSCSTEMGKTQAADEATYIDCAKESCPGGTAPNAQACDKCLDDRNLNDSMAQEQQSICAAGCPSAETVSCGSTSFCQNSQCGNGGTLYSGTDSGGTHPLCTSGSPIIIDTANEGFHLTGVTNGVRFRNEIGDQQISISWTDARFHNAWLALDRNGNGTIDALSELFGNYTPQPHSANLNGYAALAVFDDPKNGGNGNGILDPGDGVYSSLRLWVDKNHDGISQPDELFTLQTAGVFAIGLHYSEDKKVDQYGNQFRYRSWVLDSNNHSDPRCYDVFLLEEM